MTLFHLKPRRYNPAHLLVGTIVLTVSYIALVLAIGWLTR
jgi:hypothetical protein